MVVKEAKQHPGWATAVGVLLLVLLVCLVVRWAPDWLAHLDGLDESKASAERGRVRTALVSLLVVVVGVAGAIYTGLTFSLSRRGQHIDRFAKAIELLGSKKIDMRLGGIYALEQLAHESETYRGPVLEVLAGYVREHAGPRGAMAASTTVPGVGGTSAEPEADADIKAVFTVLSRRDATDEDELPRLDFADTDLRRIRAEGIDLRGALFTRARLERAWLNDAQLQSATFVAAHLEGAHFKNADLTGASFASAYLHGTHLREAHGLKQATLTGARYDINTQFPYDFNPDERGAIFEGI